MAKVPDKISDYALRNPTYVQPADHEDPVMVALIEGIAEVMQEQLEDPMAQLHALGGIRNATGAVLDTWGELVDESRRADSDTKYRTRILGKIRRNNANGTWRDTVDIALALYPESALPSLQSERGSLVESYPAQGVLHINAILDLPPEDANSVIQESVPAGVQLYYIYHVAPQTDTAKTFLPSTVAEAATLNAGISPGNVAQTTGGALAGVLTTSPPAEGV